MKSYPIFTVFCVSLGVGCQGADSASHSIPLGPLADPTSADVLPDAGAVGPDVTDSSASADAGMRYVVAPNEQPLPLGMRHGSPMWEAVARSVVTPPEEEPDAGTGSDDGGDPTIDYGPPREGTLRSLTVTLTGMGDDLHHFSQFRVVDADTRDFATMFVIHEGLTSATYQWSLPNTLLVNQAYTLDFFIDHDENTGPGFYDDPPVDHAWTLAIPAGVGDVNIEFPYNTDFFNIESTAPTSADSLLLNNIGIGDYIGDLFDVRIIDRTTGRLVGRQVREIPGDTFEMTVGESLHEGTPYEIDVAIDADHNGHYNYSATPGEGDPSWTLLIPAGASSWTHVTDPYDHYLLQPTLDASGPTTDVHF